MTISQAAARVYAKALFDIGENTDTLEQVANELSAVRKVLAELDPELRAFIEMPQLPRDDKRQVIQLAFGDKVGRSVLGLLSVLVDRRRETLFDVVVSEFDDMMDAHTGSARAEVITARPLDAELLESLRLAIEHQAQAQVVLDQRVDPSLIGGVRVNLGDLVIDGTVRRALHDLRRSLASSLP